MARGKARSSRTDRLSKTARASTRGNTSGTQPYQMSPVLSRIVPLAGGTRCWVRTPDGRVRNLAVSVDGPLADELARFEGTNVATRVAEDLRALAERFPEVPAWAELAGRFGATGDS